MNRDPFNSPLDSLASIGSIDGDSVAIGWTDVAIGEAVYDSIDGYLPDEEEMVTIDTRDELGCHECDAAVIGAFDIIGQGLNLDDIGLDLSDVQKAGDMAKSAASTVKALSGGKKNKGISEAAAGIRSVTRSPILHAGLAATAAVVPVGTVIAGVGELAIGAVEGVTALVEELGGFFDCLFGCRPARTSLTAKQVNAETKRALELAKKQFPDVPEDKVITIFRNYRYGGQGVFKGANFDTAWASASIALKPIQDTLLKKREAKIGKAAKELAVIQKAAKAGDREAQKKLVAIQFMTDSDMVKAQLDLAAKAKGFTSTKELQPQVLAALGDWSKVLEVAAKLRPSLPKPKVKNPKPMPNLKKTRAAIKAGAKILEQRTAKAAKARGPISGVFVSRVGEKKKGRYRNNLDSGARGWLVLSNGKTVKGRFKVAS